MTKSSNYARVVVNNGWSELKSISRIEITISAFHEYVSKNSIFMSGKAKDDIIEIATKQIENSNSDEWNGFEAFLPLQMKYKCSI